MGVVVAQSVGDWAGKRRFLGSRIKFGRCFGSTGRCQYPSEHCHSILEQGTKPSNAHIQAAHSEVYLVFAHM